MSESSDSVSESDVDESSASDNDNVSGFDDDQETDVYDLPEGIGRGQILHLYLCFLMVPVLSLWFCLAKESGYR